MAPALGSLVAVAAVIVVVLWQMHLGLLLSDTTTTGGDTGAHYMMPPYLQHLMTHGQLTGWDPSWYDGYPIYTFYFLLPDLFAAIGGWVIPYNVAFKLATVLGSLALPIAAWACGRLFRLRPPVPAALAAATLPFLFEYSFTIYGGNLFSTLAGEYAYSLSIALAVLFLGLVAAGIRTGRRRGWAAIVLAGCLLAHIVPAMFAMVGAVLLALFELLPRPVRPRDDVWWSPPARAAAADGWRRVIGAPGTRRHALSWTGSTIVLGLLLTGFWLVPLGIQLPYTNSMGYQNVTTYVHILFPGADLWAMVIAAASLLLAVVQRSRLGLLLGAMGGASVLALVLDPQGKLYNARFLPLWFLCVYLMAGWGVASAIRLAAVGWRRMRVRRWARRLDRAFEDGAPLPPRPRPQRWPAGALGGALLVTLGALAVVIPPFVVPAGALPVHVGANEVSNWAQWNYSGYEGKPAYPEYRAIIETMRKVARRDGCGRAMWEYNPNLDRFGTPMALMLLPYWTGGCIDSMEGLLFESSATTPYHFLNQAELSEQPSEPMVGLPYGTVDVTLGVQHLQLLGVRYFMASSPEVQAEAAADPELELIASTGPWNSAYGNGIVKTTWQIYKVRNSTVVTPLLYAPAVLRGVKPSQSSWLHPSVAWYGDPARWDVELAAAGPRSWPRVRAGDLTPPLHRVPATSVSQIRQTDESISFRVSRLGSPVLVKVSYFPNWQASGASGPWRVTPNLMVVVPTSHRVRLIYAATAANDLGFACTIVGLALLLSVAALWVWRSVRSRRGASPLRSRSAEG